MQQSYSSSDNLLNYTDTSLINLEITADKLIKLPSDICRKIYSDNFSVETRYTTLDTVVKSEKCRLLDPTKLVPLIKSLMVDDEELLHYILAKNALFCSIYTNDIVHGNKHFRLITCDYLRISLSWLYHLYH
jgi:hypothetical protein